VPRFGYARSHQREPALIVRALFGLFGAIAGALITAPTLALAAAFVSKLVYGPLDKVAYMQSGMTAGGLGIALGVVGGGWLVLHDNGSSAGPNLAWLWVGALIILACLVWVALQ
jgi:MFS family permease